MRFWRRATIVSSTNQDSSPEVSAEPSSGSTMVAAIKLLEQTVDTVISSVVTPLNNLKSVIFNTSNLFYYWYANVILFVLATIATLAILHNYRKTLRSSVRKIFRQVKTISEPVNDESEDDDDDDDDEEEESDDSDDNRGRGDRSTKKYYRYNSTSRPSRTRQRRRR